MGSSSFTATAHGTDINDAFATAVGNALAAGLWLGTIAVKAPYGVVTDTTKVHHVGDATAYAHRLLQDPIDFDKWGPTDAIPVHLPVWPLTVNGPARTPTGHPPAARPYTYDDRTKAAARLITAQGLAPDDADVVDVIGADYHLDPDTGDLIGTATAYLTGGPFRHNGWLFYGYASD